MFSSLPLHRRVRVWTVGLAATVSLYAIVIGAAEPLRSLAAAASDDTIVSLTVAATITNTCDATLSIGTITGTGDSSTNN